MCARRSIVYIHRIYSDLLPQERAVNSTRNPFIKCNVSNSIYRFICALCQKTIRTGHGKERRNRVDEIRAHTNKHREREVMKRMGGGIEQRAWPPPLLLRAHLF